MQFKVTQSLVTPVIIGNDVLAEHEVVEFRPGGTRDKLTFCASYRLCASTVFPTMSIDPPVSFSDRLWAGKSAIVTKSRRCAPENTRFMREEVARLLHSGIVEESCSPWRAQAFVVSGHKKRMVVDYSQTINLYTEVDAYPFPDIDLILKAADNSVFSKLDLKSAYHQIPLRIEDRPMTKFEVDGKLYQFTRLPFGVTNAVPAFQRIMDSFVDKHALERTHSYLDDVIIGGRDKEVHDRNLTRSFQQLNLCNSPSTSTKVFSCHKNLVSRSHHREGLQKSRS